jgi:hypothetical protein
VGKLDAEAIKVRQQTRNKSDEDSDAASAEFFSGSLGSLLDVASTVRQIEIKRSSFPNRLHEEIDFILK